MHKSLKEPCWLFLFVFLWGLNPIQAQKTDRIQTRNGDWITGDVKRMDHGIMVLSTDAAAKINIKWPRIHRFYSDKSYFFNLTSGEVLQGRPDTAARNNQVVIVGTGRTDTLYFNEIVAVYPFKERFWRRFDGNIGLGFSYAKGSDQVQFNGTLNITYRGRRANYSFNNNALVTGTTADTLITRNLNSELTLNDKIGRRFFMFYKAALQQNTQLGTKLRALFLLGPGLVMVNNYQSDAYVYAGLSANREESFTSDTLNIYNLEGVVNFTYEIFRFAAPSTSGKLTVSAFPSLSSPGRFRFEGKVGGRIELFSDFYFETDLYLNTDNQPPSGDVNRDLDWGVTTGLSYSF